MTIEIRIEGIKGGLNGQTPKAYEIDILKALFEKFKGTQMYLESLFTGKFVDWVAYAIRDDLCPDIWASLDAATKEASEARDTVRKLVAAAEEERKTRAHAFGQLQSDKENVEAHWRGVVKDLEASVDNFKQTELRLRMDLDAMIKDAARLEEDSKAKEAEIVMLKAKLYDMKEGKQWPYGWRL